MTILEQLQSAFPDVEGIGDARNIAEALAMISGAGGRGANAIADKVSNPGGSGGDVTLWDFLAESGQSYIKNASEAKGNHASFISESAFFLLSSLTVASFPNASYISSHAFNQCDNLATASFPNAQSIGDYAFNRCRYHLTEVTFPKAQYVGEGAFANCEVLATASFPNASYIGAWAFSNCFSLTTASFPNVSYIGASAFGSCYRLISLYLTGGSMSQAPTMSGSAFYSTPIGGYSTSAGQYGSVYVPASLYSDFLTASVWSDIASCIVSVPES